jgi:transposase
LGHVYPEPKFLDFAHHHGFIPRLCRPYRAKTNVPLASQLSLEGLKVDRDTANARVGTWLREVANARVHAIERCRYA